MRVLNDNTRKLETIIENFIQKHKSPGLSLQLVFEGKSFYQYNHGYSNLELKNLINQDSVHSIMSITKSFAAMAMLHLEETTHFNIDTPIVEYLPYFRTKSGRYDKITSKHILSHTAGFPENIWIVTLLDKGLFEFAKTLPEYQFIFKQFPNIEDTITRMTSREDVTKYFGNIDLAYEPGEGWKYCTDAYVIIADILEKISGLTWEEYVMEHILTPLHMDNTHINPLENSHPNMSDYYLRMDKDFVKIPTPYNPLGAPIGFVFSTTNDMAMYLIALMDNDQKIISQSSKDKMFEMIAQREPGLSYGLGWKVKTVRDIKVVEHAGGYPGVSSFASMVPDKQFGVIVLSNTDEVPLQMLSDEIIDKVIL